MHVADICHAHLLALQAMLEGKKNILCNLGTGQSYSVLQVVHAARRVTGKIIPILNGTQRPGDAAVLVADATLAKHELNWQPTYTDIDTLITHAWRFSQRFSLQNG